MTISVVEFWSADCLDVGHVMLLMGATYCLVP